MKTKTEPKGKFIVLTAAMLGLVLGAYSLSAQDPTLRPVQQRTSDANQAAGAGANQLPPLTYAQSAGTNRMPGETNLPPRTNRPGLTNVPPGNTNMPPGRTNLPPGGTNTPRAQQQ